MIKCFVCIVLGLFFFNSYGQNDFGYYKVYELNISDLNLLTTNENYDFGYNYSEDLSKSIEKGYYLWIENTWYKVDNADATFEVEDLSPLYFKIDKRNEKELQIKDSIGAVYSYKVALLENYLVSELIYKTNLDVIQNIAKAESSRDLNSNTSHSLVTSEVIPENSINDILAVTDKPVDDNSVVSETNIANAEAMLFSVAKTANNDSIDEVKDFVSIDNAVDNKMQTIIDSSRSEEIKRTDAKLLTGFFIAPNVELPVVSTEKNEVLYFDLFEYYQKNFSDVIVSSSGSPSEISILKNDFEYQITSFDNEAIEILGISNSGVLAYKLVKTDLSNPSVVNVRYLLN